MTTLPTIDPSMIPHTKCDRNLPYDPARAGQANTDRVRCPTHGTTVDMRCDTCLGLAYRNAAIDAMEHRVTPRAHGHYFKDVSKLQTIDVYRALALFNVTDPCLQHAVKKLLVAGGRGGGKDISRDIQEAIDTLVRWQEMRTEEAAS